MSFETAPKQGNQRRPPGKGGFMLLVILGVVAFFVVQSLRNRAAQQPQGGPADRPRAINRDVENHNASFRPPAPNEPRAESATKKGDWSIEEVDVKPSAASDRDVTLTVPTPASGPALQPDPKRTTKGDWSIEEVNVKPSSESSGGVTLTVPTSSSTAAPKPAPKRTTKGDWSIEELDAQKSRAK
jgi:hypothetical protein